MGKDQLIVNGTVELVIAEKNLAAKLIITYDKEGDEWTPYSIIKLIKSNEIDDCPGEPEIDKKLRKWMAKPEEPLCFIVSEGVPAEETQDETVEWQNFPIPENLEEKAEEIFNTAEPPRIVKTVKEKVKVEKVVKQKSLLPFLPSKEETIKEWEQKESIIEIPINPEIRMKGFVAKDQLLAKIIPGKIGKPGVSIYNKPVPPSLIKKVELHPGEGILKQKSEYKASEQGFLRIGDNWLDIIPYKIHTVTVKASTDGKLCFMDIHPGNRGSEFPDIEKVLLDAEELGFDEEELIDVEEILNLVKKSISENKPVLSKILNQTRDSVIELNMPGDKSSASLTLKKERGKGKPLTLESIGKIISGLKLKDLNKDQVKKDVLTFFKGKKPALIDYSLAQGTPPHRGKDGSLDFKCDFLDEEKKKEVFKTLKYIAGKLQSETMLPVDKIEELAFVEKDQKVAVIIPPSLGSPGVDIYGNEIPATRGNDPDIALYENITLSKGSILTTISGVVEIGKKGTTTVIRVREFSDARIIISITEDKTKAYLTLLPPRGIGKNITLEDVEAELEKNSVSKGINEVMLPSLVEKVQHGEEIKNFLIAKGMPPCHASGRRLTFFVDVAGGDPLAIREEKENKAVGQTSKEGSCIAEIKPPSVKPQDGWDISGKEIKAGDGIPIEIETGPNVTKVENKDGTIQFIANKSGEVFYDGKILDIKDMQIIEGHVGPKTGNINVSSSVSIEGSVYPGYKVFSKGNIIIKGSIQEAVLSSDGSITVDKKVIGKSKAVLRSREDIKIGYAENATVLSVGDIYIRDGSLGCILKSNGRVIHTSTKAILAGGSIRSKKGVELVHLGSVKAMKTELSFGQDYLISDQIEIEEKEITKLNKQVTQLDKQMERLEKMATKNKETLYKIRKAKRLAMKLIEKRNFRLFTLREKFEEHFPSEIIVKGFLFPGVVIESHGRLYEVTEKRKNVRIFFNIQNGRIEEEPLQ